MKFYPKYIKPPLDYSFAFILILLLSPLLIIITAMVLLFDSLPIIFKQKRIGQFDREFTIYKFKTMSNVKGPLLTFDNDKRITKLGKFLRKYKFDELPQLFNILKGDMSFVGPRPEVPILARERHQISSILLNSKPGMTGLSSIRFIDESKYYKKSLKDPYKIYFEKILPKKIAIDEQYVASSSFALDLKIVLETFKIILFTLF